MRMVFKKKQIETCINERRVFERKRGKIWIMNMDSCSRLLN